MITAIGLTVDVPATSRKLNIVVVFSMHWLEMLLVLPLAVGQITTIIRLIYRLLVK
jgi:hypothetical protein